METSLAIAVAGDQMAAVSSARPPHSRHDSPLPSACPLPQRPRLLRPPAIPALIALILSPNLKPDADDDARELNVFAPIST